MKIKILLIALLFSVVGYGQNTAITINDGTEITFTAGPGVSFSGGSTITIPTGFTNAAPAIEYGTCVYLNRNDKIQIAKQATRSTYTEYMEDGPLLIASQEITYKTKYGINIPEDAVILFKIKPKK